MLQFSAISCGNSYQFDICQFDRCWSHNIYVLFLFGLFLIFCWTKDFQNNSKRKFRKNNKKNTTNGFSGGCRGDPPRDLRQHPRHGHRPLPGQRDEQPAEGARLALPGHHPHPPPRVRPHQRHRPPTNPQKTRRVEGAEEDGAVLGAERRHLPAEHPAVQLLRPTLHQLPVAADVRPRLPHEPHGLVLDPALPRLRLPDHLGPAALPPQQNRQLPLVPGYSGLGVSVQSGSTPAGSEHQQGDRGLAVQHRRADPVPAAGDLRGDDPAVPDRQGVRAGAHVPAVLAVHVRVQVVQHGLGAPPAAHLHRDQLALLPGVRHAAGGAHPDLRFLDDQRMRFLHPVPPVHNQRERG